MTMGLGFSLALLIEPGDCVQFGGKDLAVFAVDRDGPCWPYYTIGVIIGNQRASWQNCGLSAAWYARLAERSKQASASGVPFTHED